jgi:hypothetical protein
MDITELDAESVIEETSQASNLLQRAQERRQQRETHLYLDVPTWDGDLVAEYRILDPNEMKLVAEQAAARMRTNHLEPGENGIALIASMCVGLHVVDRETSERVPIMDEFGVVNYSRIAKFLGKSHILKTQSDAVKYLMSERDPDDPDKYIVNLVAITLHANAVQSWMRDTSKRTVDLEALLGEF